MPWQMSGTFDGFLAVSHRNTGGPNPSNTVAKKKGEMMKIHNQVFSPLGSDGFTVMFTVGEEHGFDAEAERRCRLLALELTGAMRPADVYVVHCDMVNSGDLLFLL